MVVLPGIKTVIATGALLLVAATLGGCGDDSLEAVREYQITVASAADFGEKIGALEFTITPTLAGGDWVTSGGSNIALCTWLVDADFRACAATSDGDLHCAVGDSDGFLEGSPIVRCTYANATTPQPRDFDVRVLDATAPTLEPIAVLVFVASVSEEIPATTTTSSLPAPPREDYAVYLDLDQTSRPLGALQFDVVYVGSDRGHWRECSWLLETELQACNPRSGARLTCALVDPAGFSGPTPLLDCTFRADAAVTSADFSVIVTDASDPNLDPIHATVSVTHAGIR